MLHLVFAAALAAATPSPSPAERIAASRSSLAAITDAARNARYVFVGEDHGTREIAQFADELDAAIQPFGYNTLAVETGPLAATEIQRWLPLKTGAQDESTFEHANPGTIAFFTWQEEYTYLAHAAQRSGHRFDLWGLDQELMGAPGFILKSILETHPGSQSTKLVRAMLADNNRDYIKAAQTGAPPDMYLLQEPRSTFTGLQESLKSDGSAKAQALAQSLYDTYNIYVDCCNEHANRSNRNRAVLMKQTYLAYQRSHPDSNRRILFKFGEEHAYRGINPVNNNDIGNFITEEADGRGTTDVHVLALGISGTQTVFAGIGKHWAEPTYSLMDDDHTRFHFLKPFIDIANPTGYTVYDLRPFRSHFAQMGIADLGYFRLVYGYDFLVLIQNTTADPGIDPTIF